MIFTLFGVKLHSFGVKFRSFFSGVATGGQEGQSTPLTAKNLPKIGKKRNREGFITLPLLTDITGYATALFCVIFTPFRVNGVALVLFTLLHLESVIFQTKYNHEVEQTNKQKSPKNDGFLNSRSE